MVKKNINRGFSLVELSIILVILGLLVSAIFTGRELINTSNRLSLIDDIQDYKVAINNFKIKYDALPGDLGNARSIFNYRDGNEDGIIDVLPWGDDYNAGDDSESLLAWQMLATAGFIKGTYTGEVADDDTTYDETNLPYNSDYNGYFWLSNGTSNGASTHTIFTNAPSTLSLVYRNSIIFGDLSPNADEYPTTLPLTVNEAHLIDLKIDDGFTRAGKVWGFHDGIIDTVRPRGCSAPADGEPTEAYKLYGNNGDELYCAMAFIYE